MSIKNIQKNIFLSLGFISVMLICFVGFAMYTHAAPNLQINYQGKLTDASGIAVPDGDYSVQFSLYTTSTGGSNIWTETNSVTVTNGLFSIMLGSSTSLTSIDFNQTLYLTLNVESDGEMSPRKILGTVPSAFEADKLDNIDSTSFLRSDVADTATGLLTFSGGLISASTTITNLTVNGEQFTDLTGTGLARSSTTLTLDTTYLDTRYASTSSFDTEAELESLLTNVTNVFTNNDTIGDANISDTITASNYLPLTGGSLSGNLILSGTSANIALGSNWLSGDGGDEGIFVGSTGNVGIGTTSPLSKLDIYGDTILSGSNRYLNFGSTNGITGYGFRDNAGTLEYKNSGGSWAGIGTGTSDGVASSSVAFSVHKNGTAQTVTANIFTKLTWSNEVFDTNNNFASDRFTPTVAGKYLISAAMYCAASSGYCDIGLYKNGDRIAESVRNRASSIDDGSALSYIVDMNGTTDYLELWGFTGGTAINGNPPHTYFTGALIAPSNGLAGGWSNDGTASYLADYTDLVGIGTSTASAKLDIWGHSGYTGNLFNIASSTGLSYLTVTGSGNVLAKASGYYNFGTTEGTTGYGIRDNAGTLEYKNSGGDWAGIGSGTGGGVASSSVAFSVHKNGTYQTVTADTWTLLTWAAEDFDTNNNFDLSTDRFTPTVAGKYIFNLSAWCTTGSTGCYVDIRKNGTSYVIGTNSGNSSGNNYAAVSGVVDMNGTTDYVEVWVFNQAGTQVHGTAGNSRYTHFSGALIAPSNGLAGGWSNDLTQSYLADSTDLVGIGTTTASAKLDIWGHSGYTGNLFNVASSTGLSYLTVTGAGNVGIGTTMPSAKLDISGASIPLAFTGITTGNQYMQGANTGGSFRLGLESSTGVSVTGGGLAYATVLGSTNATALQLGTNNAARLTIDSTGNVGIGTTTPSAKLHITNTGSNHSFLVEDSASPDTTPFVIDSNGNVGIGTSAPTGSKLEVVGGDLRLGATYQLEFGGNTEGFRVSSNSLHLFGRANTRVYIDANSSGNFAFEVYGNVPESTNTDALFTVRDTGNVGIGATSPLAKLDIFGDAILSGSNRYLNFGATVGTTGYGFRDNAGTLEYKNSGGDWAGIGSGTGDGVASSSVAFSVHRNNVNQTVTNGVNTLINWTTEDFDTNNNFDLANDKFQPTVAGKYILTLSTYCSDATTYCQALIKKNGSTYVANGISSSPSPFVASVSAVVDMNGTTDYVETYVVDQGGITLDGDLAATKFTGALIAPSNGLAGGWSNDLTQSYLADSTDLVGIGTTTASAKLDIWGHSGYTGNLFNIASSTGLSLLTVTGSGNVLAKASGYYNFGTTEGTTGYGIRDNAGTLEYKNSGGDWAEFGTGGSGTDGVASSSVAFSVNKGGTDQTSIPASTWTKVTWSNESFDTNNNFASNAFTPTIAGKYILTALIGTDAAVSGDLVMAIYKNGAEFARGSVGANTNGAPVTSVSAVVDANGVSDFYEVYVYSSNGSITLDGRSKITSFSGALIAPSNGLAGGWSNDGTASYLADYTDLVGIGTSTPSEKLTVVGNAYISGNLTTTGTVVFNSPITVGSGTGTSTFNGNINVTGNIVPSANDTYSLGSPSSMWKDVYVGPGSLYVNGKKVIQDISNTMTFSTDANQHMVSQTSGSGNNTLRATGTGTVSLTTDSGNLNITSTSGDLNIGTSGSGLLNLGTVASGVWNGTAIANNYLANSAMTINGQVISLGGTATITAASSTLLADNNTWTGTNTHSNSLILSGSSANIALGSNWLSGDGGDEGIFVGSTGNVGVGTTSPTSKMHVYGGGIIADLTTGNPFAVRENNIERVALNYNFTDNLFKIQTVDSTNTLKDRFVISSEVDTAAITAKNINTFNILDDESADGSFADVLRLNYANAGNNTGSVNALLFDSTTGNTGAKAGIGFERLSAYGVGTLHFFTNSTAASGDATIADARMSITSSGNVGIGTTSPSELLHLSGTGTTKLQIDGGSYTGNQLRVGSSVAGKSVDGISIISGADQGISFMPASQAGMVITSTGNVGIGTTSPQAELHVHQTGANVNFLLTRDNYGTQISGSDGASNGIFRVENMQNGTLTEHLRIDASGNVGIGTTNPGQLLHLWSSSNSGTGLSLENTDASGRNWRLFSDNDGAFKIRDDNALANRLAITSSGSVGIGTTDPSGKLHINGATLSEDTFYFKYSSAGGSSLCYSSSGTYSGFYFLRPCASSIQYKENVQDIDFSMEKLTSLRPVTFDWKEDGTPSVGFIAEEIAEVYPELIVYDNEGNVQSFEYKLLTAYLQAGVSELNTRTAGILSATTTPQLFVAENGNVGIGNSSPTSYANYKTLHIGSSATSSAGLIKFSYNGVTDGPEILPHYTSGGLRFNVDSSTNAMTIDSSGNVGIGITTPTYKLQVNGQPAANGYTAWTNYSDQRLKENVTSLATTSTSSALSKLKLLRPVTFNYNDLTGYDEETRNRRVSGFIAQELREVFPTMVGTTTINGIEYLDTNTSDLSLYLILGIQELDLSLEQLLTYGTTTSTSTFAFLNESDTVWSRLVALARGFVDGVLTLAGVHTDELCIGDTCVDEETLKALLQNAQQTSSNSNTNSGDNSSNTSGDTNDDDQTGIDDGATATSTATSTDQTNVVDDTDDDTATSTDPVSVDEPEPEEDVTTPPDEEIIPPVEEVVEEEVVVEPTSEQGGGE